MMMSLQLNSSNNAITPSENFVFRNGCTLEVNRASKGQQSLSKEVIVIVDDDDDANSAHSDKNTQNPEFECHNHFSNGVNNEGTQYKKKGNLKGQDKLYSTDDMVISTIAVQYNQNKVKSLENASTSPNPDEKQDLYDLYYKEVEDMLSELSELDQVNNGTKEIEKADNSNTDDLFRARNGTATPYCNESDKREETDILNCSTNSVIDSAKQIIAKRYKLLQPKGPANMEEDVSDEQTTSNSLETSYLRRNVSEKRFMEPSMLFSHLSAIHIGEHQKEPESHMFSFEKYETSTNEQSRNVQPKTERLRKRKNAKSSKKKQESPTSTLCGKKYMNRHCFKMHLQEHPGEKVLKQETQLDRNRQAPFKCSICGKEFAQKSYIKLHLRTHTGEKPYSCSLCGKRFAQTSSIKLHLRTHTGEKPYSCTFCGKRFAQASSINQHLRTHTGEKPYSCSFCGKRFAQASNIKQHLRIHTGEKPYKCHQCDKTFSQKSHITRHLQTHR